MSLHKSVWLLGLAAAAATLILAARYCVTHYVDFPVYWNATNSLLNGRQDLYDPTFVWGGAPDPLMTYRYPPLFLLIFVPLGMLAYTTAGYVWFALKVVALFLTVRSILWMVGKQTRSSGLTTETQRAQRKYQAEWNSWKLWAIPFLIAAPYLVEEFHYGNVHFFVVFLCIFALYLFEAGKKTLSASVLALSIAIKVFPVFFLPYFLIRKKFQYIALTLLFLALFNILPGFYFGFQHNAELLATWYDRVIQDREFHEFNGGINHSLKGVLQRYFSRIPYELRIGDSNFPNINHANLQSGSLQIIWYAVTGGILLLILLLCLRQEESSEHRLLTYGLLACATVAFAPSTGYNYFGILIFPGFIISAYLQRHSNEPGTRAILLLVVAAVLLSLLPPLVPGSAMQRKVQVHSPYFFSAMALFMSLVVALVRRGSVHHRGTALPNGNGVSRTAGQPDSGSLDRYK